MPVSHSTFFQDDIACITKCDKSFFFAGHGTRAVENSLTQPVAIVYGHKSLSHVCPTWDKKATFFAVFGHKTVSNQYHFETNRPDSTLKIGRSRGCVREYEVREAGARTEFMWL